MRNVIPAISTVAVGPLGVMHLALLWFKNLLFAVGRLPSDYKHTTGTFDRMVIEALGIDEAAMLAYIRTTLPDYLQFEAWAKEHAEQFNATAVRELNARYLATEMSEQGAQIRRSELGLDGASTRLGTVLNDLDDWAALHRQIVSSIERP